MANWQYYSMRSVSMGVYRDTLDKGAQKRLICPYLCRPT